MKLRRLWLDDNNFPTSDMVRHVLSIKYFNGPPGDSNQCHKFAHILENGINCTCSNLITLHAKIHFMILGTMIVQSTNSDDPLFIVHHMQVDRLFSRWFRLHRPRPWQFPLTGDMKSPGHCRHCNLVGFLPTVKHSELFVDTRNLGYDYDNFDFGRLKATHPIKSIAKPKMYGCDRKKGMKAYKLMLAYLKMNANTASVKLFDGSFYKK